MNAFWISFSSISLAFHPSVNLVRISSLLCRRSFLGEAVKLAKTSNGGNGSAGSIACRMDLPVCLWKMWIVHGPYMLVQSDKGWVVGSRSDPWSPWSVWQSHFSNILSQSAHLGFSLMIAHCNRCSIEADFHSFCVARSSFQTIVGNHIYIYIYTVYICIYFSCRIASFWSFCHLDPFGIHIYAVLLIAIKSLIPRGSHRGTCTMTLIGKMHRSPQGALRLWQALPDLPTCRLNFDTSSIVFARMGLLMFVAWAWCCKCCHTRCSLFADGIYFAPICERLSDNCGEASLKFFFHKLFFL